jgi:cytochrome c biogenesis protein CcmG, thiol:disulfide interchange protein DsbE
LCLVLLAAFLGRGLQLDPRHLPSAQIDKQAPAFTLPVLGTNATLTSTSLKGKVWILNVFASWCAACVIEHPRLLQLQNRLAAGNNVAMIGLAYKDHAEDSARWLQQHGNPYSQVALDLDGKTGIDYGVYGVPETFVIDADGVIRYRHVGPISDDFYEQHVLPVLK